MITEWHFIKGQNHFTPGCQTLIMKTQCLHSASVLGWLAYVGQGHSLWTLISSECLWAAWYPEMRLGSLGQSAGTKHVPTCLSPYLCWFFLFLFAAKESRGCKNGCSLEWNWAQPKNERNLAELTASLMPCWGLKAYLICVSLDLSN